MEAMAALSRTVIDEVLNHTQDDILIGHDEHVARGIVRELQMRWERKLSEAYAQIIADKEKLTRSLPGQIHPGYHSINSGSNTSTALPTIKIEASSLQTSTQSQSKRKPEAQSSDQQSKKAKVQYESDESSLGTDDESEDEQVEPTTNNLILCQSSKVQNHKGRWKCQFSGGIMNLRGRDYVFRDATGDFRFDKSTS